MRIFRPIAASIVISVAGCAGYSIDRIKNVNDDCDGYVFYGPEPYLLRTANTDKEGKLTGYTYNVIYLPNPNRRYRVDTWNFLGSAKFTFAFEDGWKLTSVNAETDNTAVATQFLATLGELAPDMVGVMAPPAQNPEPQLYSLRFDENGVVVGIAPVTSATSGVSFHEREATRP